ncbi:MAG TPA: arginine--tRNA ligase [Phycisphaerae bacterium]|jgi:arginyl-tRNA synthetase|nr:arginine--tRNA ligase [Phycisphaerae bacterium]HOB75264.1 arginine--tRNA ligase [Phycisphaerae bacterium]HOJ55060.1 arginine--tRNA ligase [Phycisphaerae bacterium]HOL27801.1 arginine--tRNA ligase [Phycisphaerae bacterium]HPP22010.1 arginine--tRNA ligase [Phycisphaerae bacterium]
MKSIATQLEVLFKQALSQILGDEASSIDPLIRVATDDKFGDYQSNVAMGLGKRLNQKPRDIATRLVEVLNPLAADMCQPFEIAGPGFINIRLKPEWMARQLDAIPAGGPDDRLGMEPAPDPDRVVVDYSCPNIAKQMHVGHLRSTIIGDSIARILAFQGHEVIRQNHIGDWGTQFGMLIAHLKDQCPEALTDPGQVHLEDLEAFYREANKRDKEDPAFAERARAEVVALHSGQSDTRQAWQYIVEESRRHYEPVYRRLGVLLTREDERGESFYADRLERLVNNLAKQYGPGASAGTPPASGLPSITVEESEGALCVFLRTPEGEPIFKGPEGNPLPLIIRKSDGAFLYATTDLAALDFRIHELKADRVLYVTGAPQALHFQMVFATVRALGWTIPEDKNEEVRLEHVAFGSVLGEDRKILKTRAGSNVKLAELLEEAVRRAEALIRASEADPDKRRGFSEEEIQDIAEAVGIGAVKYADLSQNRQSDYVFSFDKMLALEGNTAPYLMYAYARIRSIYRKGATEGVAPGLPSDAQDAHAPAGNLAGGAITLDEPQERTLGKQILQFSEILDAAAENLKINLITDYLYGLAGTFMKFYENCPVLSADTPEKRASRLRLCDLTARTLKIGLGLLGIRVVERM